MRPFRVSIAATLGIIAVCALGFMGLREGKPLWASLSFCLSLGFLLMATLRGMIGPKSSRPGSIGFALFGWAYLATIFGPWGRLEIPTLPQVWCVDAALERIHPQPEYEQSTWQSSNLVLISPTVTLRPKPGSVPWSGDANGFRQSAHSLGSLAFGIAGLLTARFVARRESPPTAPAGVTA